MPFMTREVPIGSSSGLTDGQSLTVLRLGFAVGFYAAGQAIRE